MPPQPRPLTVRLQTRWSQTAAWFSLGTLLGSTGLAVRGKVPVGLQEGALRQSIKGLLTVWGGYLLGEMLLFLFLGQIYKCGLAD